MMHTHSSAFTLVETLVAITVITLAIVGPYTLVGRVLQDSYLSRDTLVASGLAQEGVEYIRQVRDSNYLAGRSWLTGLDGCYSPTLCTVDVTLAANTPPAACGAGGCAKLYLNTASNLYTQQSSGGTQTRFTRTVQFNYLSDTEVRAEVVVTWDNHGTHTVTLVEYLRDWL